MIAIIKYNAGNIASVQNALNRLGATSEITDDPATILRADKVIFPGVGEASSAMAYLRAQRIDETIRKIEKPMLGICLGLQLMCTSSEEGNTACLDIFDARVKIFPPKDKVPHMGWNNFSVLQANPLLNGIELEDNLYYVHRYFASLSKETIARCDYIQTFSSVLQKDNFYATQFHPEKSAETGARILQNFLNL
ncbi:MAG: imidazole glycerol phosphate synthase subunit HisH [Saprospiraceae bacterium]